MGGRNRVFAGQDVANGEGAGVWAYGTPASAPAARMLAVAVPTSVAEIYRLAYERARAAVAGSVFYEICVRTSVN